MNRTQAKNFGRRIADAALEQSLIDDDEYSEMVEWIADMVDPADAQAAREDFGAAVKAWAQTFNDGA